MLPFDPTDTLPDAVDNYINTVGKLYTEKFGIEASFYISDVGDGGMEVKWLKSFGVLR